MSRLTNFSSAFAAVLALSLAAYPVGAVTTGAEGAPGNQTDVEGAGFDLGSTVYGRFLAALHAEAAGNFVAAADITADIITHMPDYGKIKRRAHLLMVSAGRLDTASEIARDVLKDNPGDPLPAYTLYVDAVRDGRFEDALALLADVPDIGVNSITKPLLRAWALAGAGKTGEAIAGLDALATNQGLAPIAGFHQGLIADLAGDMEQASAAFGRTLESAQGQPSLQLVESYGRFLVRQGRDGEAQTLVDTFRTQNPKTLLIEPTQKVVSGEARAERVIANNADGVAEVLRNVSGLLNRERLLTEALLFVRMSLGLDADNPTALFSLGQLLEGRERNDLAVEVYRKIADDTPYHWYARLSIADALHADKDTESATAILRKMIDERKDRADAARTLADLLRIDRQFEEAVEVYDLAYERTDGRVDWSLLYTRGIALERAKKWDRAEKDFLGALEIEPEQPLVLNYLGYSWVEQGINLEQAKAMIETAVAKRPDDGYITDSLGWVLYRLGSYEEAVPIMERAVALEPGDPVINDHLGDVYWSVGRKNEARFQWDRALTLKPEPDVEAEIRKKISGEVVPEPLPPGKKRDI